MNSFTQMSAILRLHLRTLRSRRKSTLVVVTSLAAVVCTSLSLLSMGEGIRVGYARSGNNDIAIVQPPSDGDRIPEALIPDVSSAPQVLRTQDGAPVIDSEVAALITLTKKDGDPGYTAIMGIGQNGPRVTPRFRLVSGRLPDPDAGELLVGRTAQEKFASLRVGDTVSVLDTPWRVVGVFATDSFLDGNIISGTAYLSRALQQAKSYVPHLRSSYSLLVGLSTPASLTGLRDRLRQKWPAYRVQSTSDLWRQRFEALPLNMVVIDLVITTLVGLGAFSATFHIMESVIADRAEEIAVLRAIGYSGALVATSFVIDAMILAILGAGLGTAVDWAWLDGHPLNGAYGVFRVRVDVWMFAIGSVWSLAIALLGAVIPASRMARVPIAEAIAA